MKKLNNSGWGLITFLAFIIVFFFVILLIAFFADKNGMGSGDYDSEEDGVMIIN